LKPKFLLSRYFFLSVLLILILTAFGGALRNEFTWDDRIVVLPEQAYRSADIVRILSTPANSLEYQPIRDLTFALDFTLWGEWSLGFHLTSLLLYLAGVVSVWVVAEALLKRLGVESYRMAALITAALFGLHPWHVEVVNLQVARNVLLSGLFVWLSLLFYLRYRDGGRWPSLAASIGFFTLALGSKVDAVCLLPAVVFLEAQGKRKWKVLAPFLVIATVAVIINVLVYWGAGRIKPEITVFHATDFLERLMRALIVLNFFIKKGFWPFGLNIAYGPWAWTSASGLIGWPRLIGLGTLAIIVLGAWASVKSGHKEVTFGLGWFLFAILPYIHLLPVTSITGDRHAYLASFDLCAVLF
jgi:hypothetical protein